MCRLTLENVGKDHGTTRVLGDVSIEVDAGELLVLVGPSGCGKSTLLRCIAGLEQLSRGAIKMDGRDISNVEPRDRDIAMVFQSYALYPHLTVRDNLAFGLKMRKTPKAEIETRISEAAAMLGLESLLARKPAQLSGGQRQRVAMGRAVVRRPKVFLFDEPLSNLDAALRGQMRVELMRLHHRLQATMVYVTHDQVEAMTLADRIAVLNQGRLMQIGKPDSLYLEPANEFVARFIGMPEMNLVDATEAQSLGLCDNLPQSVNRVGIRAEDLHLSHKDGVESSRPSTSPSAQGRLEARISVIEHLGWESLLHVSLGHALELVARAETAAVRHLHVGERVHVGADRHKLHLFGSDGNRLANSSSEKRALP